MNKDDEHHFFEARDTLFGLNMFDQNVSEAVVLLSKLNHPEAVFLTSIFQGLEIASPQDAEKVLLSVGNPQAIMYAKLVGAESSVLSVDVAKDLAKRGSKLAELWCASRLDGAEGFEFSKAGKTRTPPHAELSHLFVFGSC